MGALTIWSQLKNYSWEEKNIMILGNFDNKLKTTALILISHQKLKWLEECHVFFIIFYFNQYYIPHYDFHLVGTNKISIGRLKNQNVTWLKCNSVPRMRLSFCRKSFHLQSFCLRSYNRCVYNHCVNNLSINTFFNLQL